jgi:hypothetical protein
VSLLSSINRTKAFFTLSRGVMYVLIKFSHVVTFNLRHTTYKMFLDIKYNFCSSKFRKMLFIY